MGDITHRCKFKSPPAGSDYAIIKPLRLYVVAPSLIAHFSELSWQAGSYVFVYVNGLEAHERVLFVYCSLARFVSVSLWHNDRESMDINKPCSPASVRVLCFGGQGNVFCYAFFELCAHV